MKHILFSKTLLLVIVFCGSVGAAFGQTTFSYTGAVQTYTVPAGVTVISVDVWGAAGGTNSDSATYPDRGGYGGRTQALLTVVPGAVLDIFVGDTGAAGGYFTGGAGGYNGGGTGGNGSWGFNGGGGGGASHIGTGATLADRIVIAGGGGGAALECASPYYLNGERGGDGGDTTGEGGAIGCFLMAGGGGGTQSAGGAGGFNTGAITPHPGTAGALGLGGSGSATESTGGGGGGGYYGGGGGEDGGGGDGSSFIHPTMVTSHVFTRGYNTGTGRVIIGTTICTGAPAASVISGPSTVCLAGNATFTSPAPGGYWHSTNGNAMISPGGTARGISYGMDTIIYTVSNACGIAADSMIVRVDSVPLPGPVGGTLSVCAGDTVMLTDTSAGGTWTGTAGFATIGLTTGMVTGVRAGYDTVTYTIPSGCKTTAIVTVNPQPSAIAGAAAACIGATITLTDGSFGGTWTSSSTAIATVGAMSGVVTGASTGTVTITYTLLGCTATKVVSVNSCPLTTEMIAPDADLINILPNPSTGAFTISGSWATANNEIIDLEIADLAGQFVYKDQVATQNGSINKAVQLNSTLAPGIYLLRLKSASVNKVFRVVVQ